MARRIYDSKRWLRLRRMKLREHPLCEACLQIGQIKPATAVDHRVRIAIGGDPYPALDGLASLCARHHNAKTRAEQMGEENYMLKGCDVFGYPLDPRHPWYRGSK
jgi:5-methylcytosine-specific restriction enzyme A